MRGFANQVFDASVILPGRAWGVLRMGVPVTNEVETLFKMRIDLVLLSLPVRPEVEAATPIPASKTRGNLNTPFPWS